MKSHARFAMTLLTVISAGALAEGPPVQQKYRPGFTTIQEVMIPMRDAVKLETVVLVPRDATRPLPMLLVRSPYGVPTKEQVADWKPTLAGGDDDPCIFVVQNIRGRFKSEGTFVMFRPPRDASNPKAVDEATDAYDTIEWLVRNVANNNGKVGMSGTSYPAWLVTQALRLPHPALRAVVEQASPEDMFVNDDFHHNGAFRLSYGFEYAALLETAKDTSAHFAFDRYDTYSWYLALGALSNANARYFHGALPTWNDFVAHPNHDFWKQRAVTTSLKHTSVPTLNVAGWYDQEDFVGPTRIYATLEQADREHLNYFVAGPWNHGGWSGPSGRKLGDFDWGSDLSVYYRANLVGPWFAHWLEGRPFELAEATTFQTGSNTWKRYDEWPPTRGVTKRRLYFRSGGALAFEPPTEADAVDSYVSDPASPVPYRKRPIPPTYPNPSWTRWLVEDQRFVEGRPDVLTWQTPPLTEDLTVTGSVVAQLFASTSGSDSDWVVKVIDVFPEDYQQVKDDDAEKEVGPILNGFQLMIASEILRARYRNSLEKPEPLVPNHLTAYTLDLHPHDHVFAKGHRIMVQVQSTWFPLYDRNPQKYVDNIYLATDADYVRATQKVYRSKQAASNIEFPVMAPGTH